MTRFNPASFAIALTVAVLADSAASAGVTQVQRIRPTPRSESQVFGLGLSFDGTTIAVGAGFENSPTLAGAAYLFQKNGSGTWVQTARLRAPTVVSADFYGTDLAVSGQTLIVGAPGRAQVGAVFVYENQAGTWTLIQTLSPSNPVVDGYFGDVLALEGDLLAVTSWTDAFPTAGGFAGREVNIFERVGGSWVEQARLPAPECYSNGFTASGGVAVSDGVIFVGGSREVSDGADVGAVFVYEKRGPAWQHTATIRSSDRVASAYFGQALAADAGRLIVSAPRDPVSGFTSAGSAYVFEGGSDSWVQTRKMTAPQPAAREYYGVHVALDGDNLLVGAYQSDPGLPFTRNGYACLYEFDAAGPGDPAILTASDGEPHDLFGWRVAVSGPEAVVSAIFETLNRGSAYVYAGVPQPCPEDIDASGTVDLVDLALLLTDFGSAAAALPDDIDADGDVDLTDLATLLIRFGSPC